MPDKPTYGELEERVKRLEKEVVELRGKERRPESEYHQQKAILDNIPDIAWLKDKESRFIAVNGPFGRACGVRPEDLVGKTDLDIWPKDLAEGYRSDDREVMISGRRKQVEEPLADQQGKTQWIETIKTPIYDSLGEIVGTTGIARDITKRKRMEDALRNSEETLRAITNTATDAIIMMDGDGLITYWNLAAEQIFGYGAKEAIGKDLHHLLAPEEFHNTYLSGLSEFNKTGRGPVVGKTVEFPATRGDGTKLLIEMSVSSLMIDGKWQAAGIIRDITKRKRMEEELLRVQKLKSIGLLAGGIAHDFNNLLMVIQGNISLMLLRVDETHPHYDRLKRIEKQVQSGAKLTTQLLGYARKGKYEVKAVDLNQLVRESAEAFGRTKKEITIQSELAEGLASIEADQGQMEQVLWNLFVNAADAMPGGGNLILRSTNVGHEEMTNRLYDPKPGPYVLLTVTDTGIGMDKKTQEYIFDPFFTTKDMGRGTGLGLASVYGIIKSHNGYIDVESKKGKGTTFSIYLPASGKKVKQVSRAPERFMRRAGTVLLVDDEEAVLQVGAEFLGTLGYEVLKARDGTEAVTVYKKKQSKIDLVILDMVMPNMGGGQAFDQMKELNPQLKVLLSSGYSLEGEASEIMARGCDGFIQKPFNLSELSKKIEKILRK